MQSLLRLRMLQRGMAFAGSDVPPLPPKPSRVNKPAQGSSIMHLRYNFNLISAEIGLNINVGYNSSYFIISK